MWLIMKYPVELFTYLHKTKYPRRIVYRRFATVAEAVRYAVEETPIATLPGAVIQVNERRIAYKDIRKLYKKRTTKVRGRASDRRRR